MAQVLNDAGVSEREAEVLALVGEHLTNAEVATRLFISVRTVESHVSSLLRKLALADRRALAELAAGLQLDAEAAAATATVEVPRPVLPAPLTSFVGRVSERAGLADALAAQRLVTAVGPGGVGKTRLALAVAADLTDHYAGGAWYVDLVPVTDPTMVGAAVAAALGFGEQASRSPTDTVITRLGAAAALVVLDNCEHVLDGVVEFVERLLSACPNVVVLATSRARLLVPFESVFPVPGLSLEPGDPTGGEGDAVALFIDRATMAGWSSSLSVSVEDRVRIATICDGLDGIALAIELAAARLATLGLDGLEAGLANQLGLLTGGRRMDERHRSVRSALDWSYGLLDPVDQVVLRRASVFAAPFTAEVAASVVGHPPLAPGEVVAALGQLAEHSLLVVQSTVAGTRYRMLETIREYGEELLEAAGEQADAHGRHLDWCLATASQLPVDASPAADAAFDAVADDLRAALAWSSEQPDCREPAYGLARRLAALAFARGMPSEAQRRYQQGADLARDDAAAAEALHLAAGAALCRLVGNDAVDLYQAAAAAAQRAGDVRLAALELTRCAEFLCRSPGMLSEIPPQGEVDRLVDDARRLAGDDPHVTAAILTVEAGGSYVSTADRDMAERAVELAREIGDARLESAALDQLTVAQMARGELLDASVHARRRIDLLAPRALEVDIAFEYSDALHMAPMTALGVGDLAAGRRFAQQRRELPFFREEGHLRVDWLVVWAALAGEFDQAVELAGQFRLGWERTGRLALGGFAMAPSAVAMVCGLRGDDTARQEWLDVLTAMRRAVAHLAGRTSGYGPMFDATVALHRSDHAAAVAGLDDEPEELTTWLTGVWRQWYAALWAEAGVLAGFAPADQADRVARARVLCVGNPIATAIVDRADALSRGDLTGLGAVAEVLDTAGSRYQAARTLVFAGGDLRTEGEARLAALGASTMPV